MTTVKKRESGFHEHSKSQESITGIDYLMSFDNPHLLDFTQTAGVDQA